MSSLLYPVSEALAASNFRAICEVFPLHALVPGVLARPTDDATECGRMICCRPSARLRLNWLTLRVVDEESVSRGTDKDLLLKSG